MPCFVFVVANLFGRLPQKQLIQSRGRNRQRHRCSLVCFAMPSTVDPFDDP